MPWIAIIFFNHFMSDLVGVKSKVGLCFTRIQSNELRNPIYQTKSTKPYLLSQIYQIKSIQWNPQNKISPIPITRFCTTSLTWLRLRSPSGRALTLACLGTSCWVTRWASRGVGRGRARPPPSRPARSTWRRARSPTLWSPQWTGKMIFVCMRLRDYTVCISL